MRTLTILLLLLFPAVSLPAQAAPDHVIVASRNVGAVATALFDVDLVTGAITPIGRFSLDRFPPLAVEVDEMNRDVVVALQTPVGSSVLVRLRIEGAVVAASNSLGDVPGLVHALAQAVDGSWITTTDAGVFATERNGSVARSIVALTRTTAIQAFGFRSTQAVVARSGAAGADPEVRWLDLATGRTIAGPWSYPGHTPLGITGVADLPTGASRQVMSQEDGTIAISVNFASPTVIPLSPTLPPGATTAMRVRGIEGIVLGGAAHPHLKSFQALGGTQWTMLAGPLAGDPVDFAFRPAVVAQTVEYGASCAAMQLGEDPSGGAPVLGNAQFGLRLARGTALSLGFLLLGFSDQRNGTLRLPATLPGGCRNLASGEVVEMRTTDALGGALVRVPVPSVATLHGAIVFTQWVQLPGGAIDTSNAAAVWLAR